MQVIVDELYADRHAKWAAWTTQEIRHYLKKYGQDYTIPGQGSYHRRKKIKFLKNLLVQREKAERLILGL